MDRLFLPFVAQVKLIIMHIRPHLDELGAWWLATRFGTSIFPGIENAKLVLWNAGIRTPDGRTPRQWKEESGALLLGVGGAKTEANPDGAELDEHGLNSENTTMTLVAGALGLMTEPALRGLLKYTQVNDRKGNATPWDLASILKALNAHTLNTQQVADMVFDILNANYNRELKADSEFVAHKYAHLFDVHLSQWLWETFAGKAQDSVKRPTTAVQVIEFLRIGGREDISEIGKLASRDHTKGAAGPFDIVTMFSELVENGADADWQRHFVYTIMNAKFAQQRRFMQAVEEVRTSAMVTWIGDRTKIDAMREVRTVENRDTLKTIADLQAMYPEGDADAAKTIAELKASMVKPARVSPNSVVIAELGIRPVRIISIVSDNEEIIKAMRVEYPDAQFYIRRQTSKHTVINGPKSLMDSVCAETRINEHMRCFGSLAPRIPVDKLRQPGNITEDKVWSYHHEGGQMLNGSLTSPGAPPTLQTLEGLWKGIARALRYQARSDRKVRINGAPAHARRQSVPTAPAVGGSQAPKAKGNRNHRPDGRGRDRRRQQQVKPAAVPGGPGFNTPFEALQPVAPVPVGTESVVTVVPVAETVTPTPEPPAPLSEPVVPAPAPEPPTRKATKPRIRKATRPKSDKA